MYIRHCGITGFKVDTGEKNSVLCDKCCFRDCEKDCIDHVPCQLGWYFKKTKTKYPFNGANENAVDLLLMKENPLTQIEYCKATNTYIGISGNTFITETNSYLTARISCLKNMKKQAVRKIMSSRRKKHKGLYTCAFRDVPVGVERTRRKAQQRAVENIKDYFDIIIEKEILDGASK